MINTNITLSDVQIFSFFLRFLDGKFVIKPCTKKTANFGQKKWPLTMPALCIVCTVKLLLLSIFGAFLWLAPGGEELGRDGEAVDWKTWWT